MIIETIYILNYIDIFAVGFRMKLPFLIIKIKLELSSQTLDPPFLVIYPCVKPQPMCEVIFQSLSTVTSL